MRKKLALVMTFTLLLIAIPFMAFAIEAPHTGATVTCNSCHNTHTILGTTGFNNVCTTCHTPGSSNTPFTEADAANPYGTYTGASPAVRYQTSHNWAGKDALAQAGALAPTDPYMTTDRIAGKLLCVRCHSVHGRNSSAYNSPKFVRVLNNNDQMCLDCHRTRDHSNQIFGTHPVNVTYDSTYTQAQYTSKFYYPPRNANPLNPIKTINGKIQCTSCHGVHYTDSRSGTTHNAANFNKLSTSNGGILRTNLRAPSANGVSLCTNCHKGQDHNGANQGVQCADCHSGHVEYVPDSDPVKTPNLFMLKRYVSFSTATLNVKNKRVVFTSNTAASSVNSPTTGACTVCHAAPVSHTGADTRSTKNCTTSGCHEHKSTSGGNGFSGGCTSCHGQPPSVNTAGGPNGFAAGYVGKNEATSGHSVHVNTLGYTCNDCHNGYNSPVDKHNKGSFTDLFVVKTGIKASTNGANPTYVSTGNGTCSNVYCHSSGEAAPRFKDAVWGGALGTIRGTLGECKACHNGVSVAGSFNNLSTNSHFKHVDSANRNIGCAACHAATVTSNTVISTPANHINGSREVSFGAGLGSGTNWTGSQCSTSYCHSNGATPRVYSNPTWSNRASGQCGTCHAATPSIGGATVISTNAHFKHLSTSYGPKITKASAAGCQSCHTTYTTELASNHIDGTVQATTCSTCHPVAASWTGAGRIACTDCHDGTIAYDSRAGFNNISAPRKVVATFTAKGHGQTDGTAVTWPATAYACTRCHDNTTAHISGVRGDATRLGVYESNQNGLCTSCHNNASIVKTASRQNLPTHVTAKGGPANGNCSACHDVHGTANYFNLVTSIKYNALSSAKAISFKTGADAAAAKVDGTNYVKASGDGFCQICHTKTKYFMRYNRNYGFAGQTGYVYSYPHPGGGTNCIQCHSHSDTYAFKSGGTCDSCHGYPPVPSVGLMGHQNSYSSARLQNYSGGGGVHAIAGHIPNTVKATAANWANDCNKCHYNTSHTMDTAVWKATDSTTTRKTNVSVVVDPQYKFNVTKSLDSSRYIKATPANSGTCSNVSCHFKTTPTWATDK